MPRWANWNPRRKKDAIDEFLRQKKPDNAVVVNANWRDNPWFPAVLEEERRLDLQLYPERYAHVWEAEYAKAFEGAYFARHLEQARQERRIAPACQPDYLPGTLLASWASSVQRSFASLFCLIDLKAEQKERDDRVVTHADRLMSARHRPPESSSPYQIK